MDYRNGIKNHRWISTLLTTYAWSDLPHNLRFLIEPACTYGPLQFDNEIHDFYRTSATPELLEELSELNALMIPHDHAIDTWIDQQGITNRKKAALLYFLTYFLFIGKDAGYIH